MARVGVDIDGVLYPFDEEFRNALVRCGVRTREQCPPVTRWEFFEDWGLSRDRFVRLCDAFTNNGQLFWKGDPYPFVKEQLQRLRDAGHTIVLITNRNFGSFNTVQVATKNWLASHQFPYDELHFVEDKTDVQVDWHIDDNYENFRSMEDVGVCSWLLSHPHNSDYACPFRVQSLTKYVDLVLEYAHESSPRLLTDTPTEGTYWTDERNDILDRFAEELSKATGDGSKKRQAGEKPPWFKDNSHEGAIFSHLTKWKRGEQVDPDSGAHPLVHAAWRCLAIACQESGNVPE